MKKIELLAAFEIVNSKYIKNINSNFKISEKVADIFYLINNFDEEVNNQNLEELLTYIETAAEYDADNVMNEFIKAIPSPTYKPINLAGLDRLENSEEEYGYGYNPADQGQTCNKEDLKQELLNVLKDTKYKLGLKIDWLKYIILKDENRKIVRSSLGYHAARTFILNKFKTSKLIYPIFMANPNDNLERKLNLDSTLAIINIKNIKNIKKNDYEYIRNYVVGLIEKLECYYDYSNSQDKPIGHTPNRYDFRPINPENEAFFSELTKVRKASDDIVQSQPKRSKTVEQYNPAAVQYETSLEKTQGFVVTDPISTPQVSPHSRRAYGFFQSPMPMPMRYMNPQASMPYGFPQSAEQYINFQSCMIQHGAFQPVPPYQMSFINPPLFMGYNFSQPAAAYPLPAQPIPMLAQSPAQSRDAQLPTKNTNPQLARLHSFFRSDMEQLPDQSLNSIDSASDFKLK